MTNRTDHAAEATLLIDVVQEWQSHEGSTDATHLAAVGLAQVHATLELANQQRIANLIALASMAEDDSKHEALAGTLGNEAVWALATTKMNGLDDEVEIVNPDIAAALGIA